MSFFKLPQKMKNTTPFIAFFLLLLALPMFGQNQLGINLGIFPLPKLGNQMIDRYNFGLTYTSVRSEKFNWRLGINYVFFKNIYEMYGYYDGSAILLESTEAKFLRHSLESPIEAVKTFYLKKSGTQLFNISIGALPTLVYKWKAWAKNKSGKNILQDSFDAYSFHLGLTCGVGYQFKLSDKLFLNIELQFKFFRNKGNNLNVENKNYGFRAQLLFGKT